MKNKDKIINVALYIRVSSEEQVKHGYSLSAQEDRLTEYCKENNYKIIDIYKDEGKTARTKLHNRKELKRLVEDAKKRKFNRVIFWRLDRWFRNISDYYKVQEILEENKIDWECSDEEYNTTTSNGRLHLNIKLSIAQNESDQTSDRIKFNFNNMVQNGRAIQGSHCMPFGYIVSGKEKNKKVVKDEEKKEIVNDMFNFFQTFNSIRKTLRYINDKYNLTIHYDSMRNYLKNELYTGTYKNTENYCEAYITKEQYLINQKNIKRNVKSNEKKYDYIFSGLVKCKCCNYNMSGFTHTAIKKKYNKSYVNPAYRCNRAYNSGLCENKSPVMERHLENYLIENFEKEVKDFIYNIENLNNKEEKKVVDISKLNKKIDRINELYIEGKLSKEKYDLEYQKINTIISDNKHELKEKRNLEPYNELLNSKAMEIYNKLNNTSKRAFWARYIDYIEQNKEKDKEKKYIIHF